MSVPAIKKSKVSAANLLMVGLICAFSVSGLSAVSNMEGTWSGDRLAGRELNSRIRSLETLYG